MKEESDRVAGARRAEADATRRQREAAHNDAVAAFHTLLAETVKDPAARWQVRTSTSFVAYLFQGMQRANGHTGHTRQYVTTSNVIKSYAGTCWFFLCMATAT